MCAGCASENSADGCARAACCAGGSRSAAIEPTQHQTPAAAGVHMMSLLLRRSSPGRLRFREKGGPAGRIHLITSNNTLPPVAQTCLFPHLVSRDKTWPACR